MTRETIFYILKTTIREWFDDNSLRLGAALSYYTIFSLSPLLIIVIAIAGLAFGNDYARVEILKQLEGLIGPQGTAAVGEMLQNAAKPKTGMIATILGLLTVLFGATGVVTELKAALNTIWEIDSEDGIKSIFRDRARALAMVLGIGFLLLVSLVISATLTSFSQGFGSASFLEVMNFIISTAVITVLFALIFKYLPDTDVKWRNVWIGAFVTAILFTIGKTLTAVYIAKSSVASGYGAAGSLVIVLLWVYYNSQILFLGAEFTQVYSRLRGDSTTEIEEEEPKERLEREAAESDMHPEEGTMENSKTLTQERTIGEKIAYLAGYELSKLDHTRKELKKESNYWEVDLQSRSGDWSKNQRQDRVEGLQNQEKIGPERRSSLTTFAP